MIKKSVVAMLFLAGGDFSLSAFWSLSICGNENISFQTRKVIRRNYT